MNPIGGERAVCLQIPFRHSTALFCSFFSWRGPGQNQSASTQAPGFRIRWSTARDCAVARGCEEHKGARTTQKVQLPEDWPPCVYFVRIGAPRLRQQESLRKVTPKPAARDTTAGPVPPRNARRPNVEFRMPQKPGQRIPSETEERVRFFSRSSRGAALARIQAPPHMASATNPLVHSFPLVEFPMIRGM